MYKVFYNDRVVFFIDNVLNYIEQDDNKIHYYNNKKQLRKAINIFIKDEQLKNLYIVHKDIDLVFNKFTRLYELIEAAGGLVKNIDQKILLIFRCGKWDLPKGKLKKDELPEIGAIREVEEECGIQNLEIKKLVEITYHTYKVLGKDILKRTYWYEMVYHGNQNPTPQIEEEITEVKWIKNDQIFEITDNTFLSIIDVFKKGGLI